MAEVSVGSGPQGAGAERPEQPQSGAQPRRRPARARAGPAHEEALERLLEALQRQRDGDFSARVSADGDGVVGKLVATFNEVAELNARMAAEFQRVGTLIGREGRMAERVALGPVGGAWARSVDTINALIDDLVRPTTEVARVIDAVAQGDLSQQMALEIDGQPVKGEFLRIGTTVNSMVDQLSSFADEVTRVAREVGTEGKLGGQARVEGVSGTWRDLTDSVNFMAGNLTDQVRNIAQVTTAVAKGDLSQKITVDARGEILELKDTINTMVDQLSSFADEVTRVAREVGNEGKLGGQARVEGVSGTWKDLTENVNQLAGNLTDQVRNIAQVATAVARGDLTQKITVDVRGEILELKDTINTMVDQLSSFADEVTRVAREVGTDGKLGGQARVEGVSGTWRDLTDSVNFMAGNLTDQVRNIAQVTTAVARGDLTQKITVDVKGEILELKDTINTMVDQLSSFADEVTRVAREVGTEGKLGGQARVEGVSGTWRDLTDNVNFMARNLTDQVRNIAQVATAVARGDLSQKISVDAKGEVAVLAETINTMVDTLRVFAEQVTRVAREVGTEGKLGGQAAVPNVAGTWKDLTDSVNFMAGNLTAQVRDIAQVTTAVARGDLSQKITVDVRGEILELKNTINTMVDQLSSFADEVTRVAREVGTEGKLGGQAQVRGVSGTWRDLTENVNQLAGNLTDQVRNIAQVATAVARGDLTQKITVDARGEILELKDTINTMVDQLSSFADEVTRVAREVGTDGKLGGQARVKGVSGLWKDLTDSVNFMAGNLTAQVRDIAQVTTAVAKGDLTQKITVDVKGEILELKDTINTMVDQLSSFADEVTRVAREVGTEGKLGGQARVEGVSGTWKDLTDNVNQLAGNLTTQVRSIAEVSTAVTQGDLTRSITVEAQGEVLELKNNINQMIVNLRETTRKNADQDWLNTNLARFSGMMQGQRDLHAVCRMIMSELTPVVSAQHGAFFLAEAEDADEPMLSLIATYGYKERKGVSNRFAFGEGLVGQAAIERESILVTDAPADYIKVSSGLGEAAPVNIVVLPVLFEDQVLAVIELASLRPFAEVNRAFLEQLTETIGVVLNTITANMRTEELLEQSQLLAAELQTRSQELQSQQDELRVSNEELETQAGSLKASEELLQAQREELQKTNAELQEKAELLARQKEDIELKNREIEQGRRILEERAMQLTLTSKYKSEFLANMSHELRTPLNSLMILARLLGENAESNLTNTQVEFANTILAAGNDLLALINDILDLSKVEAGRLDLHPADVSLVALGESMEQAFRPQAEHRGIEFRVEVDPGAPATILTDGQRLQQILNNLLSNACKFTHHGSVSLTVAPAPPARGYSSGSLRGAGEVIAFAVADTGIGIPGDKLQLIFEAFQQADGTTARRYGGTGLGLSISRELATLLGGEIQVHSEDGQGSTFTLFVPARLIPPEPLGRPGGNGAGELTGATAGALPPAEPAPSATPADDRETVADGDRVLLLVDPDAEFASGVVATARSHGLKCVVASRGEEGLALARQHGPAAIILETDLPGMAGLRALEALKRHPGTCHIPVHMVSSGDDRHAALAAGAAGFLQKPLPSEALSAVVGQAATFTPGREPSVLVVGDDAWRTELARLLGDGVSIARVSSATEALEALAESPRDCLVLDLRLPELEAFQVLEALRGAEGDGLPVVVRAGEGLTLADQAALRGYADALVIREGSSPGQLVRELALCLHRPWGALPDEARRLLAEPNGSSLDLRGRRVLIVDDDERNVFALRSALALRGMDVAVAEDGAAALASLERDPDVDLVLMDVMMPELDGYETTRAIRRQPRFAELPVITLTAKAMKGDREKSIEAGASDYIAKPVEIAELLALMRMWIGR